MDKPAPTNVKNNVITTWGNAPTIYHCQWRAESLGINTNVLLLLNLCSSYEECTLYRVTLLSPLFSVVNCFLKAL